MSQAIVVTNKGSSQYSFTASCRTLQGNFQTVRGVIPGGQTATIPLPAGVTPNDVAQSPEVVKEMIAGFPHYTIAPAPPSALGFKGTVANPQVVDPPVWRISNLESLEFIQAVAASVGAPGQV